MVTARPILPTATSSLLLLCVLVEADSWLLPPQTTLRRKSFSLSRSLSNNAPSHAALVLQRRRGLDGLPITLSEGSSASPVDEEEDDNDTIALSDSGDSELSDHDTEPSSHFSKSRWKKKKFWMMRDVSERISRGDPSAPRKAEEMVRRMHSVHERAGHPEACPDIQAYNLWIHALAKAGDGTRAEEVLRSLQGKEQSLDNWNEPKPNVVTYTSVMDAYANSELPDAASRAEGILWELLEECEKRQRTTGRAIVAAGSRGGDVPDFFDDWRVTPVTIDAVLNAWAKQRTWKSASRTEEILTRLEACADEFFPAPPAAGGVRPTEHSYATVIHAWASCQGGKPAALRAQAVLDRMLERADLTDGNVRNGGSAAKSVAVAPDTVIFNAVIHAWANSGDPQSGSNASALLNRMQELHARKGYDCRPDVVSYNTVLSAWSHSGHANAASRAEKLLNEMLTAHRQGPEIAPAPNTVPYNSVFLAWSQSPHHSGKAAERAEAVLNYMLANSHGQHKHEGSEGATIAPDVYSFTSVLNAVAKSKLPDKAVRANAWLERMCNELYLYRNRTTDSPGNKLTQVPFNSVLNACAFSALGTTEDEQRRALQIAVQTFKKMRQEHAVAPDSISYGNMLKCTANLLPSGS